ncbi:uncharacterized protein LOC123506941 [Portunus trituberculatus]|uniref:uncharacterized protein LOC123506941 n=1 Tax=Portunus trituberculatus TaxID=210409 RepID=UPI001E1CE2B2|nr:uncharacterized protein LOC123506941 [Portunus trituberculatus]
MFGEGEECTDCYTLMKEACDSGYCWEIISNKDAMKINSVIGTMAAMIALMILVMITTLVVYFRFPPKNSKRIVEKNKDETRYEKPTVPKRPPQCLKEKEQTVVDHDPDYGYVGGNVAKVWQLVDWAKNNNHHGTVKA